jgi:hypothetical protein
MKRRLLLLVAVASLAMAGSAQLGGATPPQDVTITIAETFHTTAPFVTGDITAAGGVFGAGTTGTLASVGFKPVAFAVKFPPRDHLFVYTAEDEYTLAGGSFRIEFEASCNLVSIDFENGQTVADCAGNWQVNGGTGIYSRLKGTGTFTETQELDLSFAGTGSITLVGKMHID